MYIDLELKGKVLTRSVHLAYSDHRHIDDN